MPTTRYLCPLNCGWHHDSRDLPDLAGLSGETIEDIIRSGIERRQETDEAAISDHLMTHDSREWTEAFAAARSEIDRLRAGEQPHHDEYTQATPAQWIWHWNEATPEQRLRMAAHVQRAAAAESICFMGDHASLRERNSQLRQALMRGLRLVGELEGQSAWEAGFSQRLTEALTPTPDDRPAACAPVPCDDCPTCQPEQPEVTGE